MSGVRGRIGPVEVLDFWFGSPPTKQPRPEWFRKDMAFDEGIRVRFGATLDKALGDDLQEWALTPTGALARIVVLDQFTRNTLRDTARAFAGDALALAQAQELVRSGGHLSLTPLQRWFAYLPFEHAEDMALQSESLRLFAALAAEHPAMADAEHWARKHFEIIEHFGRYPHRNAQLGHASTPEEERFLTQPGSSF